MRTIRLKDTKDKLFVVIIETLTEGHVFDITNDYTQANNRVHQLLEYNDMFYRPFILDCLKKREIKASYPCKTSLNITKLAIWAKMENNLAGFVLMVDKNFNVKKYVAERSQMMNAFNNEDQLDKKTELLETLNMNVDFWFAG